MSCRMNVFIVCTLVSFLIISCWKKQSHNVDEIELPNYTVSGTVFHSVTNEPLPGASVYIDDQGTVTDSVGRYSISNVLAGKNHSITIDKSGFNPHVAGFLMGYGDMDSFDFVLGRLLYFTDQFNGSGYEPNGLVWIDHVVWASCSDPRRLYVLDETQGLKQVKYFDSPGSFPLKGKYSTPYGIMATEEGGVKYLWVSVAFDGGGTSVYKMAVRPDTTLSTEANYDTPESIYSSVDYVLLDDLTFDGLHIWSCSSREAKMYRHESDMSVDTSFFFPGIAPAGIAWDGSQFWVLSSSSDKLYMFDAKDLEPKGYYVLQETPLAGLFYKDGYLWACKYGSPNQISYFYAYRID